MGSLITARNRILTQTPHIETASGSIATFDASLAAPLKSLRVDFAPVQEGSGDPSPENVRPISGWIGITITRCGEQHMITAPISWQSEVGTVYGGTLTLNPDGSGDLTTTYEATDLAQYDGTIVATASGSKRYFRFNDMYPSDNTFIICDKYSQASITSSTTNIGVNIGYPSALRRYAVTFRPESPGSYTADTIMDYIQSLGSLTVCYRITPVTHHLTAAQVGTVIKTLRGVNNIWSDSNGEVTVKYWTH